MKNISKHISALVVALLIGVVALAGNEGIRIFPNPAADVVNFEITPDSKLGDDVVVTIYDLLGNIIYEEQCTAGTVTVPLPTEMPSGMYIVTFEDINRKIRVTSKMQKR
jgi:hypothetical protein